MADEALIENAEYWHGEAFDREHFKCEDRNTTLRFDSLVIAGLHVKIM